MVELTDTGIFLFGAIISAFISIMVLTNMSTYNRVLIEKNVGENTHRFDQGKSTRSVIGSQFSKRNRCNGIQSQDPGKPNYEYGIVRIIDPAGNGFWKTRCQQQENSAGEQNRGEPGTENHFPVGMGFTEAEKCGLHPVRKDDHQQSRIRVKDIHHPILCLCKNPIGIERHQKVVQKPCEDAWNAVNGCLPGQAFDGVHITKVTKQLGF